MTDHDVIVLGGGPGGYSGLTNLHECPGNFLRAVSELIKAKVFGKPTEGTFKVCGFGDNRYFYLMPSHGPPLPIAAC